METTIKKDDPDQVSRSSRPEEALCDGSQSLYPQEFGMMMEDLRKIAEAVGRSIHIL